MYSIIYAFNPIYVQCVEENMSRGIVSDVRWRGSNNQDAFGGIMG
jgi:hypothetical protein